jgi:hypothetical protein
MKLSVAGFLGIWLVLALGGCGPRGPGGFIQRNSAGTRSVVLPEAAVWDDFGGGAQNAGAAAFAADPGSYEPAAPSAPFPGEGTLEGAQFISDGVIEIKEKLFIAQTNDVYLNPEDYMGRTIKYQGIFKAVFPDDAHDPYCFVIRYGPGCCGNDGSAGFEVAWNAPGGPGGEAAAVEYPQEDAWVEALGTLKSYEEDGYPYLYLALSSLTVLEERGAEFVAQ